MTTRLPPRTEHSVAGTAPLYCLSSAGNGDRQFDRWPERIGPWRACRIPMRCDDERKPSRLAVRAAELVSRLADHWVQDFALFGHESAALLGYEMAIELVRRGMRVPSRLFVSGCLPPQEIPSSVGLPLVEPTDDELAERVLSAVVATGANPLPSVVAAGVRALRADAAMLRDYQIFEPTRLCCPLTTIWWSEQGIAPGALAGWSACGSAELVRLNGSRLSYATEPAELVSMIAARPVTGPG